MRKNVYLFLLISFFNLFVFSQKKSTNPKRSIGLVLSGGGSRGYAHIGVLRVLEELNIKPDYITGTSQGALIGAMYALGYSVSEIESFISQVDWRKVFSDTPAFKTISIFEKEEFPKYPLKLNFIKGKPKLPIGLIEGHELQNLFATLAWRSHFYKNFDEFPIPYRCLASDLISGKPVVFKDGDLATAMRASMSVPAVFSPVSLDSLLLVDGGVYRNFPVKECKEMGADIIIGVYAVGNNDKPNKKDINSLFKVLITGSKAFLNDLESEDIALTDLLIVPELNEFRGIEMKECEVIAKRGEEAAKRPEIYKQLVEISLLNESKDRQLLKKENDSLFIDTVQVIGCEKTNPKEVLQWSHLQEHALVSVNDMAKAIDAVFKTNKFKTVTYQFEKENKKRVLKLNVNEKDKIATRLGLSYSLDYGVEALIHVSCSDVVLPHSKLSLKAAIAREPRLKLSYVYYPFPSKTILFAVNSYTQYSRLYLKNELNWNTDTTYFSDYSIDTDIKLGWIPYKNISFSTSIGNLFKQTFLKESLGVYYGFDNVKHKYNYYNLEFSINTLNDASLPTKGLFIKAKYTDYFNVNAISKSARSQSTSFVTNKIYEFSYQHFLELSNVVSIVSQIEIGTRDKTSFYTQQFFIGGFAQNQRPNAFNYSGFTEKEIATNSFVKGSLGLQYKYHDNWFFSISGETLSFEDFSIDQIFTKSFTETPYIWGIQSAIAYKTPIGLIHFSLSKNTSKKEIVPFLSFGIGF